MPKTRTAPRSTVPTTVPCGIGYRQLFIAPGATAPRLAQRCTATRIQGGGDLASGTGKCQANAPFRS